MNWMKDCLSLRKNGRLLATRTETTLLIPTTNFLATRRGKESMRIRNRRAIKRRRRNLVRSCKTRMMMKTVTVIFEG